METGLAYTDILKVSGEELEFITGEKSLEKAQDIFRINMGPNLF